MMLPGMSRTRIAVAFIIVFGFLIRTYRVTSVPPSLSWDEVSIGYNAYSILKTGRDEHGRFLPFDTFVAYGDYKPPLPIYLTVPFVAIFGLTELAVRFPSVIAGTLAVLLTYILVQEFNKPKLALLSAMLLAISPWHIQLSRAGWEANIALTILLFGIWLVLRVRASPQLLVICWVPFVLAMYTYNSARYVAPLLAVLFLFWIREKMVIYTRHAAVGVVIALLLFAPLIPHMVSPAARLRFTEVNIFSDLSIIQTANARVGRDSLGWAKILDNRRVGYAYSYLLHFFDHFEPGFLFIRGDGNPKFSLQDVGQLYLIEAPLLVYGLVRLAIANTPLFWTLLLWMLFAIAPAALARETPHALRIENSLPVWQIVIAYGIVSFIKKRWVFIVYCLLFIASFFYFAHNYFNHYAREFSGEWQYGYREAIWAIARRKDAYDRVVVTEGLGRPYMYALFYEKTDPRTLWETKDSLFDASGFYHVYGFGKYRFTDKGLGEGKGNTLYVLTPSEVPSSARVLEVIKNLDGTPTLVIFDSVSS